MPNTCFWPCLSALAARWPFIVLGKYIFFRPDMSKLLHLETEKLDARRRPVSEPRAEDSSCLSFPAGHSAACAQFLPKDFFVTRFLRSIGNIGYSGLCLVTIMAAIKVDGKSYSISSVMVDSALPGHLLLLCRGSAASFAMASKDAGITAF